METDFDCEYCKKPIEGTLHVHWRKHWSPLCSREKIVYLCAACGGTEGTAYTCEGCKRPMMITFDGPAYKWRRAPYFTCSYDCQREAYNAGRRVKPISRACSACGERFTPKRIDARTCSLKCRVQLHRAGRRPRSRNRQALR